MSFQSTVEGADICVYHIEIFADCSVMVLSGIHMRLSDIYATKGQATCPIIIVQVSGSILRPAIAIGKHGMSVKCIDFIIHDSGELLAGWLVDWLVANATNPSPEFGFAIFMFTYLLSAGYQIQSELKIYGKVTGMCFNFCCCYI